MIAEIADMLGAAHKKGQAISKIRVSRRGYDELVEVTKTVLPDVSWNWNFESPLSDDAPMKGQHAGMIFGVPVHMADSDLAPVLSFEVAV